MINSTFNTYISDINELINPFLTKNEVKLLSQVKIEIDFSKSDYNANSNSDNRRIVFSKSLIQMLVRFSVAELIDFDTTHFDRKRFSGLYASIFPFLSKDIYPEDAAELNTKEKYVVSSLIDTDMFRGVIVAKIMFIYLHELKHQFQNFSTKQREVNKQNISRKQKDSLLLISEMEADEFALDKLLKMKFFPLEFTDVLGFFSLIKERKFFSIKELHIRQVNFYNYLYFLRNCEKDNDDTCLILKQKISEHSILYRYYLKIYSNNGLLNLNAEALQNNVQALSTLGDFYLKGTQWNDVNIDSALYYYNKISNLNVLDTTVLYGAKSREKLLIIIEYAQIVAGKINEILKKDNKKALEYYEKARTILLFLPKGYYDSLISRVERKS